MTTCTYAFVGSQVAGDVLAQEKPRNAKNISVWEDKRVSFKDHGASLLIVHPPPSCFIYTNRSCNRFGRPENQSIFSRGHLARIRSNRARYVVHPRREAPEYCLLD